ncbi:MAG: 2-oxoacid ferredoxin oxidoreductase [Desulfobacterales bacterium]|nr:2-oxoacid ferredoxin oxidoreductase [Desulfobacterales bacterium]
MIDISRYDSTFENKWCPGCGNFGILQAMKHALSSLTIPPEKVLIVSGIGQAGKTPHFIRCNMFHGLHGRALPVATGAKVANHDLTVLVSSGDGDCYGEGGNHFIHAIRRNPNITLLVHNNQVYGLTKGQASPTSSIGMITKLQPHGVHQTPFNPILVALSLGATFVARGFSGKIQQLSQLIQQGIQHRGFSIIDICQPCVSFNSINTYPWYQKRIYELDEATHNRSDLKHAMELATEWEERIPLGIIYQSQRPAFEDTIDALKTLPLVKQETQVDQLRTIMNNEHKRN